MIAVRTGSLAVAGLLFGATFWGLVWYPSRLLDAAGIRGAWLTLVAYSAAFFVFIPFVRYSLTQLRVQPVDVGLLILAAGWTNVAFVLAVLEGEVVRVVLLFYLSPVWTALLGRWLLHEHLTLKTWTMLGLGMGGAFVMLWDPAMNRVPLNTADLLAISSGLAFALNNVLTRRITALGVRAKTHIAWFGVMLVSSAFLLLGDSGLPEAQAVAWSATVALGVGGFMLSTLAVVYGVTHMPVQRSAVIMLFELIVGAASAWWLAGEGVGVREWFGGALILFAALIAIRQEEEGTS